MAAKCAYVKFMLEKCKRERGICHIEKRLFEDCSSQNLFFTGPQYKLKYMWINDTRKDRDTRMDTRMETSGKNSGNH